MNAIWSKRAMSLLDRDRATVDGSRLAEYWAYVQYCREAAGDPMSQNQVIGLPLAFAVPQRHDLLAELESEAFARSGGGSALEYLIGSRRSPGLSFFELSCAGCTVAGGNLNEAACARVLRADLVRSVRFRTSWVITRGITSVGFQTFDVSENLRTQSRDIDFLGSGLA
jgi:hypothetical protein